MTGCGKVATARKIIQLGEETLVVSLPSAWTRQHKLKKGDEVDVEEQGPRLVLCPKSEAKPGRVVVDVSGTGPVIKRVLGALYKAGYDELEIKFGNTAELEAIQKIIRDSFVGFEVVGRTKQTIMVRNVSALRHEEFDTLIRRVFLLLLEFGEECFKAVVSGDYARILAVAALDEDINRHVNFCRRTLNTLGHKVALRVAPTYHLVEQLERAGDCYKRLCIAAAGSEPTPKKWLSDLLADANFFVRKFYELYYKFSLAGVAEFWREKGKLEKSVAASFELAGKKELPVVLAISGIIDSVAGANGALLTARL